MTIRAVRRPNVDAIVRPRTSGRLRARRRPRRLTRPWYRKPLRSKTTAVMPFSRQRLAAASSPTSFAASTLAVLLSRPRSSGDERGDGEQRLRRSSSAIDLHVDVLAAAEHGEPRPLGVPRTLLAHARLPELARRRARCRRAHQRARSAPAALPAFRRIVSSAYLTPLPLYGSGGRSSRIAAAAWPRTSRSAPSSVTTDLRSTLAVTPCGQLERDRVRVAEREEEDVALAPRRGSRRR